MVQIVARSRNLETAFSIGNGNRYAKVANCTGFEEVLVKTDKFR
jgi:hypothetical protein